MADHIYKLTLQQKLSSRIRRPFNKHKGWLFSLATGFALARVANVASANLSTLKDVFNNLFGLSHPLCYLTWTAFIIIIVIPLLSWWIKRQSIKIRSESLLANLIERHIGRSAAPFANERIAWGANINLQSSPDLVNGWSLSEIEVIYSGEKYPIPDNLRDSYKKFFKDKAEELGFNNNDGTKYTLVKNPTAFTDAPKLVLELKKTIFSEVQFFRFSVADQISERNKYISRAINDKVIEFPSSFCMHALIVTADNKILATKRSPEVSYSPNSWSLSLEEQLDPKDFKGGAKSVMVNWAKRLLWEEVSVSEKDYNIENFRALSVFLECDILNCSLIAKLPVALESYELDKILKAIPREDYEFTEWRFMAYEDVAEELVKNKLLQHPSTGYRALFALSNRYGADIVADKIFKPSSLRGMPNK